MSKYDDGYRSFNVFVFQRHALPVLMGWAAGSIICGGILWRLGNDWWRGLGIQFVAWGIIDGVIAYLGRRGATRKAGCLASGEMTASEHNKEALRFEKVLWINAALDIGYVIGGSVLTKLSPGSLFLQGMGWGIVIQGAFLLIWDVVLVLLVRAKHRAASN